MTKKGAAKDVKTFTEIMTMNSHKNVEIQQLSPLDIKHVQSEVT